MNLGMVQSDIIERLELENKVRQLKESLKDAEEKLTTINIRLNNNMKIRDTSLICVGKEQYLLTREHGYVKATKIADLPIYSDS